MNGIQLVLVTGFIFIGLYFIIRLKKRLLDIVLLFAMIVCGIVFVLKPNVTNIIANRLGVGRGADLIFYLSILIFWFVALKLYARIRKLEKLLTEIIRNDALNKVKDLSDSDTN